MAGYRSSELVIRILFLSPSIWALLTLSRLHSQKSLCPIEATLPARFKLEGQPRWRHLLLFQKSQQDHYISLALIWKHANSWTNLCGQRMWHADCLWPWPCASLWFCGPSPTQRTQNEVGVWGLMTQRAPQVSGAWMEARLDLKIKSPRTKKRVIQQGSRWMPTSKPLWCVSITLHTEFTSKLWNVLSQIIS